MNPVFMERFWFSKDLYLNSYLTKQFSLHITIYTYLHRILCLHLNKRSKDKSKHDTLTISYLHYSKKATGWQSVSSVQLLEIYSCFSVTWCPCLVTGEHTEAMQRDGSPSEAPCVSRLPLQQEIFLFLFLVILQISATRWKHISDVNSQKKMSSWQSKHYCELWASYLALTKLCSRNWYNGIYFKVAWKQKIST